MCLFLNVSYYDMLLLAIIKKYYWKYQMSEKNLLFFYYNFDSTTLFSFGGETIMGQSKYPEILNDLNDTDLNDRKRPLAHDF